MKPTRHNKTKTMMFFFLKKDVLVPCRNLYSAATSQKSISSVILWDMIKRNLAQQMYERYINRCVRIKQTLGSNHVRKSCDIQTFTHCLETRQTGSLNRGRDICIRVKSVLVPFLTVLLSQTIMKNIWYSLMRVG